ncbi:MAG TPA: DUF1015 domain-containing protein [Anaeromyxobacteraceae bacterium]|nr:DUF1015 domain-containing protein [Anaeromyxobacteraceae bacterium]
MPDIRPFQGVRYAVTGRELSARIAPPYDVITPALRDELAARDPHGIVHLILDRQLPGDVPGNDRYSRAAERIAAWTASGILRRDPRPALYGLEQAFVSPDGRERIRRGVMAAVRMHDLSEGIIRAHEATVPASVEDRLALLRHVRTDLSAVFGLHEDPKGEVAAALAPAFGRDPVAEATAGEGTRNRIWRIEEPSIIAAVQRAFAGRRVLIADGHHRFAAALAYRDELDRVKPGLPADGGHRYTLMFLLAKSDPGLVLYPTHRLLRSLGGSTPAEAVARMQPWFEVREIEEDLRRPVGRAWAVSKLSEHMGKSSAFLLVTAADRKVRLLTLRDGADLSALPLPAHETLRALDATLLHGAILEGILGSAAAAPGNLAFIRDAGEAVTRTLGGEYEAAFLLNPVPMWQVQAVADAGLTMPLKSTWFHPKIPSGLVLRPVDPNGAP